MNRPTPLLEGEVSLPDPPRRTALQSFSTTLARWTRAAWERTPPGARRWLNWIVNGLEIRETPPIYFAVAAISVVLALVAALLLHAFMPGHFYLLFLAAVVVSATGGGLAPALLALMLSCLAAILFLLPSTFAATTLIPMAVFTLVSLLTSVLCDGMRNAQRQTEIARAQAETTASRFRFLAEASETLDTSLDYEKTLDQIAKLAVPQLADWCLIDTLEEDGTIRRRAIAHTSRERVEFARELEGRYPADLDAPHGPPKVIRTGQAEIFADISEEMLQSVARTEEHLGMLRELGFRSTMCVPLIAHNRKLGALTLATAESGREYNPTDLLLAKDLGLRAALAVDNARLYRAANQEIAERRQAEAEIQTLNARLKRAITETHHRVKNNLQLIASMVDMQTMENSEAVPIAELRQLGAQIHTLSIVHDILTHESREEGQTQSLSAKAILEKLLPLMRETAGGASLRYRVEEATFSSKKGTSLALVVNELVSNALKHGQGEVEVAFTVRDGVAMLEVCDDGPGFPPDFDPAVAANTGLELVESLTRWDLGGQTHYETRPQGGGQITITIPLISQEELGK